jgi:hypothetical protein
MKRKSFLLCTLLGLTFGLALPAYAAGDRAAAGNAGAHLTKADAAPSTATTVASVTPTPAVLAPESALTQPTGTENGYPDVNPVFAFKDGRMLCGSRHEPLDIKVEAPNDQEVLITWKHKHYLLKRKPTSTGAYHFDDAKAGFVLIQIPTKSMLFDKKNMTRLADDCVPIQ